MAPRKLKNSKLNPSAGTSEDAADRADLRASDIDQAVAGSADAPMGEGTTPLTFEERAAVKKRLG